MPKIHRSHTRSKQITQTSSMSPSYTYTLDAGGGANDDAAPQIPSDDPEEDHNIVCLTCLDECTCRGSPTAAIPITLPSSPGLTHGSAPAPFLPADSSLPAPSSVTLESSTPSSSKPPLKIKLTLRPPKLSLTGSSKNLASAASHSQKTKYAKHTETTSASESAGGEGVPPSPSRLPHPALQYNADGSVKKKRGRPTKAAVAAREAAARALALGAASADSLPDATIRQPHNPRPQSHNVSAVRHRPMTIMKSNRVSTTSRARAVSKTQQRKRQLVGMAPVTRPSSVLKKKQKRLTNNKKKAPPVWLGDEGEESSELSELEDDMVSDSTRSIQFPTFMSAFSSSSNSSSEDSSDSDSDAGQKPTQNQEADPTVLSPSRKTSSQWNNWEIRPRMRSVGAEGSSDEDTDSEEEDEEDEADQEQEKEQEQTTDDAQDEEGDARIDDYFRYAGIATGYTDDDEESSYDADLFFSNLTDSSADDSDDQMGDAENGFGDDDVHDDDMDVTLDSNSFTGFGSMSLPEVAAAGFMAPFGDLERSGVEGLPFEFTHGWDGHLLFSNSSKADEGLPELKLDVQPIPTLGADVKCPPNGFINALDDADIMMATSEEEEAVAMFESDDASADDELAENVFADSDSETTEDEYFEIDGIPTPRNLVGLHFPVSLGSINPMSTVSSPLASPGPQGRVLLSPARSARPADILAGRVKCLIDGGEQSPSLASRSPSVCRAPALSSDVAKEDVGRKLVVNGSGRLADGKPVPSPFPAVRRSRRRSSSSKLNAEMNSAMTSGPSSLLDSVEPSFELIIEDHHSQDNSSDSPAKTIELDDVIDAAFLNADVEIPGTNTDISCDTDMEIQDKHIQNLRRWDRIPMNTFRKTRAAAGVPDLIIPVPDKMSASWPSPSSRVPRPADGFSYGSSAGTVLRGSPLSTALFSGESSNETGSPKRRRKTAMGQSRSASLLISPILTPTHTRDGERTPTNDSQQSYKQHVNQQQHALLHAANIKSRKELRRQKKRQRLHGAGPSTSHHHHHFPNGKSRGFNSSQRSFSGSIPTLSI